MVARRNKLFGEERRLWDGNIRSSSIFLGGYHSYTDIIQWLKNLERQHSNIVTVKSIGTTTEKRVINGVKV